MGPQPNSLKGARITFRGDGHKNKRRDRDSFAPLLHEQAAINVAHFLLLLLQGLPQKSLHAACLCVNKIGLTAEGFKLQSAYCALQTPYNPHASSFLEGGLDKGQRFLLAGCLRKNFWLHTHTQAGLHFTG